MLTFPVHLFNPSSIKAQLVGRTIDGGESLSGETDTIRTDGGGYWIVTMSGIALHDADTIRAWRAWEAMLEDGVTRVLVPVPDLDMAPRPMAGGVLASPSGLHAGSDDAYFPEAVAFATPLIVATVDASAALRATTLTITIARGSRLKGGEQFAITHPTKGRRMYRVRQVLSRSGQQAVVSTIPPQREAVTAGASADFDFPSFVATLVPGTDISPDIMFGDDATVSITWREAFS